MIRQPRHTPRQPRFPLVERPPRPLEEVILYAIEQGLEKLLAEVLAEEVAAERALERFGFQRMAVIPGLVKDHTGNNRDLHILVLDLGTAFLPDWYYF